MKREGWRWIQTAAIHSNGQPWAFLFQGLYTFSIWVATLALRRHPEVYAVYLTAGLVTNKWYYGLSDIDLVILIKDGQDVGDAQRASVFRTYRRMAKVFPLLDPDCQPQTVTDFQYAVANYDIWTYRVALESSQWKLLHGHDFIRQYGMGFVSDRTRILSVVVGELKQWWFRLQNLIWKRYDLLGASKGYLLYKIVAEISKAYLLVCHDCLLLDRGKILQAVKEFLPYGLVRTVEDLEEKAKGAFIGSTGEDNLESIRQLCLTLMSGVFLSLRNEVGLETKILEMPVSFVEPLSLHPQTRELLTDVQFIVFKRYPEYVSSIRIVSFLACQVDDVALFIGEIDSPEKKTQIIRDIAKAISSLTPQQRILLYSKEGDFAVCQFVDSSVHREQVILDLLREPAFFPFSKIPNTKNLLCFIREERVSCQAEMEGDTLYMWQAFPAARFFWKACQLKLWENFLCSESVSPHCLPLTSGEIVQHLCRMHAEDADFLCVFYAEYLKAIQGLDSRLAQNWVKAVLFLRRFYGATSARFEREGVLSGVERGYA